MNKIDKQFNNEEINMLEQLVGSKIISFKHDELNYSNTSSQVVCINAEKKELYLYSILESSDYFGTIDDVSILSLTDIKYNFVTKKNLIESPIDDIIKNIFIVQENQKLFYKNEQTYDIFITRAIIFEFKDYQFSLEKSIWFSEDIKFQKGYNLLENIINEETFPNDSCWDKNYSFKCIRNIIKI